MSPVGSPYTAYNLIGVFAVVKQLAKGIEFIVYQITLLYEEVRTLRKANEAFVKRRRAKKIRVQAEGALSIEDAYSLIEQKKAVRQQSSRRSAEGGVVRVGPSGLWRCRRCGKTGHNIRTCQEVEETSEEDNDIESN